MNGGDSHYWTAMPNRIGLRRLIQQNAYLSDSHKGRRITGDFCARFQLPDGKNIEIRLALKTILAPGDSLDLGVNPEACACKRVKLNPQRPPAHHCDIPRTQFGTTLQGVEVQRFDFVQNAQAALHHKA